MSIGVILSKKRTYKAYSHSFKREAVALVIEPVWLISLVILYEHLTWRAEVIGDNIVKHPSDSFLASGLNDPRASVIQPIFRSASPQSGPC